MKADFVSVKDYTLSYGHNGLHIKVIRTRFDYKNTSNIRFVLFEINLIDGRSDAFKVTVEEVKELFKNYYPELPESSVNNFINGVN